MPESNPADVAKNKGIAIAAYIIFFLPLLAAKDSPFARYHANQGLILVLFSVVVNALGWLVPVLGWFVIGPIGNLLVFLLFILGVINAAQGRMKPLPLIGGIRLIT